MKYKIVYFLSLIVLLASCKEDNQKRIAENAKDATSEPGPPVELDAVPTVVKLQMTSRQERRLWRHVEAIENFWETLTEIEPGAHRSEPAARSQADRPLRASLPLQPSASGRFSS